jgi:hypothetical protein
MSFHYGNLLDFYRSRPTNRLVSVGIITYLVGDSSETILVSCFTDTGSLFMDGKFAPADKSIGETIGWFIGEQMFELDIEDLYFQSGTNPERAAKHWERGAFFMGHWKQYAKTDIRVRVTIRVDDPEQNESVYITVPDSATSPINNNNSYEPPSPPTPRSPDKPFVLL